MQFEAISAVVDSVIHDDKIAAMKKAIAYPLDPWFHLGDPRLLLGLVFLVLRMGASPLADEGLSPTRQLGSR